MDQIDRWVEAANKNWWIGTAVDPPHTRESYQRHVTIRGLSWWLRQDNWVIGQAFWFEEFAFVNQIDGGHEWAVYHGDKGFNIESLSGWACTPEFLEDFIAKTRAGTWWEE